MFIDLSIFARPNSYSEHDQFPLSLNLFKSTFIIFHQMATIRSILYVAALIWLPVYVTGGNYGKVGYGRAMFPIYPALFQTPINDFSYRSSSYHGYYQQPLSYYPSYPDYYTHQSNPIIFSNPGGRYGIGNVFQLLFVRKYM
jgi:hypothetical protein